MAEPLTLSNGPLEHPGMDYDLLRREGLQLIQALAGNVWTDYNATDPGITILEALCYAITDLSYRLSFDIEDLLAYPPHELHPHPLFLSARENLTTAPLTLNDYRRLLIDIPGVKNAWLEVLTTTTPQLYYDAPNARLTFASEDLVDPVPLGGLYRVWLEKETSASGLGGGSERSDEGLKQRAWQVLQRHRNLCEDFAEIEVLDFENITVRAEVEIAEAANPHQVMASLYQSLAEVISPSLEFLGLPDLLAQGMAVEDIFAGPPLTHGFIPDEHLQQLERRTELYTSDLIHAILDMPEITAVRHLTIGGDIAEAESWALDLARNKTPRLRPIKAVLADGDITFYKGSLVCPYDASESGKVVTALDALISSPGSSSGLALQDFPIPTGTYRELAEYETLQSEFPLNYGIGETGLPATAPLIRKAQAKQLQAYLMIFDQILSNALAQLDHGRDLFCSHHPDTTTYYSQSIALFPGVQEILLSSAETDPQPENALPSEKPKDSSPDLDRKNRLLDHLLAQYGEAFTDLSLLFPNQELSEPMLAGKAAFVQDYPDVSAARGQGVNYTLSAYDAAAEARISGLKCRLARLLGIDPTHQNLSTSDTEGFHIVEHILLRPWSKDFAANQEGLLTFARPIQSFAESSHRAGWVTCGSPNHGLTDGEEIRILYSSHYDGTFTAKHITATTFDIETNFEGDEASESTSAWNRPQWVPRHQPTDPFSFQISMVFPDWPQRFQSNNFRDLVQTVLTAEIPAHITPHIHWFNRESFKEFETEQSIWRQSLAHGPSEVGKNSAIRLINMLGLGSSQIPDAPPLIGYMVIARDEEAQADPEDETVNQKNLFTIIADPNALPEPPRIIGEMVIGDTFVVNDEADR